MGDLFRSYHLLLVVLFFVIHVRCGIIKENGISGIDYNKYEVHNNFDSVENSNFSTVFDKSHDGYIAGDCFGERDLLYEDTTSIVRSQEDGRNMLGSIQMFFSEGIQISCMEVTGSDGLGAPRLLGGGLGADNVEFDLQHYPPGTYTLRITVYQKPVITQNDKDNN